MLALALPHQGQAHPHSKRAGPMPPQQLRMWPCAQQTGGYLDNKAGVGPRGKPRQWEMRGRRRLRGRACESENEVLEAPEGHRAGGMGAGPGRGAGGDKSGGTSRHIIKYIYIIY